MKKVKLDSMVKGWFVGNFLPTVYKTDAVEVGIKRYKANDYEKKHHHKIATEITVIVSGSATMNGKKYIGGDIIVIEPGDTTDFLANTDVITAVVKIPSVPDDKYLN